MGLKRKGDALKKGFLVCLSLVFFLSIWIPVSASPAKASSPGDSIPMPTDAIVGTELTTPKNLTEVDRWGYGPLQAVRFSADGSFFIAASSYGLAKFSMEKINQKPIWMPFKEPIDRIKDFQINIKGNQAIIYLDYESSDFMLVDLDSGEKVDQIYDDKWTEKRETDVNVYEGLSVTSPDKSLLFKSKIKYKEITDVDNITTQSDEETSEEIYRNNDGELLFPLGMNTQYIYFKDRIEPEGCDLEFFSPCGNSLMATPLAPYLAAFSDNNKYLAIRYSTTESNIWQKFQLIRVFDAHDGKLLYSIGGAKQPVLDFAFQPGSEKIIIGFLDGSLQIRNTDGSSILWQTRIFSEPARHVMVSGDRRFIIYEGILGDIEVRRTVDGKVLSNYKAASTALAPRHNLLALGFENGTIQVEDMDNLKTISRMPGHKKKVLAMAFSPDEKTLVTSGQDCGINAWNPLSGKQLHSYENTYISPYEDIQEVKSRVFIYSLDFIDETGLILGIGSWGTALNWTSETGKLNYFVRAKGVESYPGMDSLKPESQQIIAVDTGNSMFKIYNQYFNLKSGEILGPEIKNQSLFQETSDIRCDNFGPVSKDNKSKFSLGYKDQSYFLCKWDATSNTIISTTSFLPVLKNPERFPGDPILSDNGSTLFVPTSDGVTFLFKVSD
jgi:WD40 repeat protein